MNKQQIDAIVEKWGKDFNPIAYTKHFQDTQFDDRSAMINYCLIREHKPKCVVEFGSRKGRCTRDIYQALKDNGGEFKFYPFEICKEDRILAQNSMDSEFGKVVTIGESVLEAELPVDIDYLFVDHSHDEYMSNWVLDELIPSHCKDGCIVQIHDLPLSGEEWSIRENPWQETQILKDRHFAGTLKLKKIYWTHEEGQNMESTWWTYQK